MLKERYGGERLKLERPKSFFVSHRHFSRFGSEKFSNHFKCHENVLHQMAWFMTSSIRAFMYNFGYVQIFKMSKVLINSQARASNECELVSKSIITAFNFLLASKMFCLLNIYG